MYCNPVTLDFFQKKIDLFIFMHVPAWGFVRRAHRGQTKVRSPETGIPGGYEPLGRGARNQMKSSE